MMDITKENSNSVKLVQKQRQSPRTAPDPYPEISIREFLDFLRTAYQVHDTVENVLLANGMTQAIDWLKLKENKMIEASKEPEAPAELKKKASDNSNVSNCSEPGDGIKRKLSEVLSEGLLDSVLPHLVPSQPSCAASRRGSLAKVCSERCSVNASNTSVKKRAESGATTSNKTDSEVEIHVCDEIKNQKKDFVCNQKLLVEKMGYFAEVTSGQKLEDMDISVHCDIGIFEWLMKWVKKESLLEEDWPRLDAQCVIPILVSAAFLQMEPLQNDCLLYCHRHMNEILKSNTNLGCLNDAIVTRLAAMYTNTELEQIRDKKDKIQSRLYTKLIQSLVELEPESVRGHWMSLARVYRCGKCQQMVSAQCSSLIPCLPACMQLQCDGSVRSHHSRDPSWNINDYIVKLYKQLKTWRKVYWRLWGNAHYLYCVQCKRFFPVHQIRWCRYHPDPPQYFTLDAQKAPLPVGRYPCCGERAYRFQLLQDYTGCQFRDHSIVVVAKDVREAAIWNMLEMYRGLIEEEPPQLLFPERLTRLVAREATKGAAGGEECKKLSCKENFWWDGFQIVPPRPKLGLLSEWVNSRNGEGGKKVAGRVFKGVRAKESDEELSRNSSESSSNSCEEEEDDDNDEEEDEDGEEKSSESSEESVEKVAVKKKIVKRYRKGKTTKLWQHNLSARSNQDIQRSYEESTIKEMVGVLNRRTSVGGSGGSNEVIFTRQHGKNANHHTGASYSRHVTPIGGLWVRLEAEWRDSNQIQGNPQQKVRSIFTGVGKVRPKCPTKI